MTTQAKIGHGTLFYIATADSPTDFVAVAEVTGVKPPKMSRDAIDATHNLSPEKWREFIVGLKDPGEVSLDLNFIPAGDDTTLIINSFNSDKLLNCRITFPDSPATVWNFTALCTGFDMDAPTDDKMTATATFKLSGKPDFIS